MTYNKITDLDFVHDSSCIVDQTKFDNFVHANWLSQYGDWNTYKRDNWIFVVYQSGDKLEVQTFNKEHLPKVSF